MEDVARRLESLVADLVTVETDVVASGLEARLDTLRTLGQVDGVLGNGCMLGREPFWLHPNGVVAPVRSFKGIAIALVLGFFLLVVLPPWSYFAPLVGVVWALLVARRERQDRRTGAEIPPEAATVELLAAMDREIDKGLKRLRSRVAMTDRVHAQKDAPLLPLVG